MGLTSAPTAATSVSSTARPAGPRGVGEYLPEMADIEAGLLAGRPPRYVQLGYPGVPTGRLSWPMAQPRRCTSGAAWGRGRDRGGQRTRRRQRPRPRALVPGAGLIYLSGGHPAYLAGTLRDTAVWAAIVDVWRGGAALAGCSAGAMALASWVPSLRDPRSDGTVGLGLLPHLRVIPHFDTFAARAPDRMAGVRAFTTRR